MSTLLHFCRVALSTGFHPLPQPPIAVGSVYEGWSPRDDEATYRFFVPLKAPPGHVFHLELGTAEELPERNSRIRVEWQCTCEREEETPCFLHSSEDELRDQEPSLVHTLCTDFYLNVEKTARWFQMLIRAAWKGAPISASWQLKVLPSSRSCSLRLVDTHKRVFFVDMVFGVQQDNTDIYLSSQTTEALVTPSTSWPQSCAVAEMKFFRHIDIQAQGDSFHLRCIQACAHLLVGFSFSTYQLKTVVMHLLTAIPLESWRARHFAHRMDDIMRYLRSCLEEKRLDHFLIGNEAVPAEITLPQHFQTSRPVNLFQHLEQEPDKHEQALYEMDELEDR
ncbi:IPIL1 protein, partial [Penelope pileata]|nr:IPIL1 protein [Penelope pileata]